MKTVPLLLLFFGVACALGQNTFTNPLLPSGPDPWVEYHDGTYYYMNTTTKNLTLWKTRNMADLKFAEQSNRQQIQSSQQKYCSKDHQRAVRRHD